MTARRYFLGQLLASAAASAQGVASRNVTAQPRGKPSGLPFMARFTDVAAQAGLTKPVIYGPVDHKDYILETIGCGCAFIDYDNDGWLDIFILNGTRLDDAPPGLTNRLYKNQRDGTFAEVTEAAGLFQTGWASAVCVGDFNNDGFDDLFITRFGGFTLYRNNGNGTFTDVTSQCGLEPNPSEWYSGCSFLDYDRDGHLDLFVATYLKFDRGTVPKAGQTPNCTWKGHPVNCGPKGLPKGSFKLFRNNGKGLFSDVSRAAGIAEKFTGYGMTAACADFDDDGWPDIYCACDSTPSLLFLNNHDGTFREDGVARGAALNEDGMEQAGMGLGIGDPGLRGHLDIFKTHFADDTSILYRNDGKGNFDDYTIRCGLGVETRYIGWGAGIVDLDNDGLPDLFLVTGNVYPEIEKLLPSSPAATPRIVFRNLGNGKFEELLSEAGPGVAAHHISRGCAFGDFDNDGDVDILVVNLNEPPSLLRNDISGSNHWLKVKLIGTKSNRGAIGARVICRYDGRQQAQEVLSQSSFYSANDRRLHFGLGAAKSASLEIRWPSGLRQMLNSVAVDRLLTITEAS